MRCRWLPSAPIRQRLPSEKTSSLPSFDQASPYTPPLSSTIEWCLPVGPMGLSPSGVQCGSLPGLPGHVALAGEAQSASATSAVSSTHELRMLTVYVSPSIASQSTRTNRQGRSGASVAGRACQQADLAREALGGCQIDGLLQG